MGGIKLNLRLLKSKRVLKGLYQYDLAEILGISHKTYNFKENGKILFSIDESLKISSCLDLTLKEVDEIFFDNKLPKG